MGIISYIYFACMQRHLCNCVYICIHIIIYIYIHIHIHIHIHIYIHIYIHIHIHIHIYIYTVYSVYIYTLFLQPCFRTYVPVTETIECQRDASPVSSVQLRTMRAGPHEWSMPYTAYPSCCKGAVT